MGIAEFDGEDLAGDGFVGDYRLRVGGTEEKIRRPYWLVGPIGKSFHTPGDFPGEIASNLHRSRTDCC